MCKFTLPEMHDPKHQHRSLLSAGFVLLYAVNRDHQPAILFTGAVLVCVVDKILFARQLKICLILELSHQPGFMLSAGVVCSSSKIHQPGFC